MARFVLSRSIVASVPGSILKNILLATLCVLACACVQRSALAQHPSGHPGVSGHPGSGVHMSAPPAPIPRPQGMAGVRGGGPHFGGVGPRGFRLGQPPIPVFRQHVFFGRPFFRFGVGLGFNSLWWPACGPSLGWAWSGGFDCSPLPYYGYGFQNYVVQPMYEDFVYLYGGGDRDLIWLYLKDGKGYAVTDYWFVNGQVHFRIVEDDPTNRAEHAIAQDELDVQKTVYVNTHRGFRIVFRDEPWQEYLKDHPEGTPPELTPSKEN